jgi:hypothetical protein
MGKRRPLERDTRVEAPTQPHRQMQNCQNDNHRYLTPAHIADAGWSRDLREEGRYWVGRWLIFGLGGRAEYEGTQAPAHVFMPLNYTIPLA